MSEQAADIGEELARYVRKTPRGDINDFAIAEMVVRMIDAPGSTPVDALAYVALAKVLVSHLALGSPEEDPEYDQALNRLASIAVTVLDRAMVTLEISTGTAAEAFFGDNLRMN